MVLTDQYGDNFSFRDTTEADYGLAARTFPSFRAAAAEAAMSRLYAGIHYRQSIEEGSLEGQKVGALVVERIMTRGRGDRTVAARGTISLTRATLPPNVLPR